MIYFDQYQNRDPDSFGYSSFGRFEENYNDFQNNSAHFPNIFEHNENSNKDYDGFKCSNSDIDEEMKMVDSAFNKKENNYDENINQINESNFGMVKSNQEISSDEILLEQNKFRYNEGINYESNENLTSNKFGKPSIQFEEKKNEIEDNKPAEKSDNEIVNKSISSRIEKKKKKNNTSDKKDKKVRNKKHPGNFRSRLRTRITKYFINIANNKLKNNKLKNYSIYIPDYKAISRNIEQQKVRKELNLPIKTILCKTNDNTSKRKRKTIKKILETITKIERDYNKDPPNEKKKKYMI